MLRGREKTPKARDITGIQNASQRDRTSQNYEQKRYLLLVVEVDDQTGRARDDLATNAIDTGQISSVGVNDLGKTVGDDGAELAGVIADLHTLDLMVGILGLNGGHVPARPAVVDFAVKVELTPGARVPTKLVLGQLVALCGAPGTLGVLVECHVLGLTGLEVEGQSGVTVPASKATIGADLVPEDNGPGVSVAANKLSDVLVLLGVLGGDLDDVAAPGFTNVALVEDTGAAGFGPATEAVSAVLAFGRGVGPVGGDAGG